MDIKTKTKKHITKSCLSCGKEFSVRPSWKYRIYCNIGCYAKSKIGIIPWNKGRTWSKKERQILSKAHIGIKMPPRTIEHRINMGLARKGAKSHLWKGGKTEENKKIRCGIEFRLWREAVFSRDNWICQECCVRGGILHPHHIKSFALFPELRFAIDNGITLCVECHKKTNNYGKNI